MPDLQDASLAELVEEMQSRTKASLIAIVPNTRRDAGNPDDDVDLFTEGTLGDRGWLLTALGAIVTEEIRKGWEDNDA